MSGPIKVNRTNAAEVLLELCKPRRKTVAIDGVDVLVREMSVTTFFRYSDANRDDGQPGGVHVMLSECIINEDGTPLMSADEARSITHRVAMPLVSAILELTDLKVE